ncbi:hypothetical protein JCM8097_001186 [Rhodosporidiobolus ruineniae]
MLPSLVVSALAAATAVQAAPFFTSPLVKREEARSSDKSAYHVQDVQIHESCNAAQQIYLRRGLNEMNTLAEHAHDRILRLGEDDPLYVQYFGNSSSATTSGFYAQIRWGNKPGVLLRCDNPDGNCEQTTAAGPWVPGLTVHSSSPLSYSTAGHWRGKNATLETVICPPTYNVTNRLPLSSLCWDEKEIGVTPPATWLAVDLLHRMTHIPSITGGHVTHAADTYPSVLALAASNSSLAGANQATFQLYALDAYARDAAYPPNGCALPPSEAKEEEEHDDHDHGAASSSSTVTATATQAGEATATTTAEAHCHTHTDTGEIHCE